MGIKRRNISNNKHGNEIKENSEFKLTKKHIVILFCIIIIVWLASWWLTPVIFVEPIEGNLEKRGLTGDAFGAANALFSGLAFCGVIIALFLQREELSEQRKELQFTRVQAKHQMFENSFFKLIDLHCNLIENLEINDFDYIENFISCGSIAVNILVCEENKNKQIKGRKAIESFVKYMYFKFNNEFTKNEMELIKINKGKIEEQYREAIDNLKQEIINASNDTIKSRLKIQQSSMNNDKDKKLFPIEKDMRNSIKIRRNKEEIKEIYNKHIINNAKLHFYAYIKNLKNLLRHINLYDFEINIFIGNNKYVDKIINAEKLNYSLILKNILTKNERALLFYHFLNEDDFEFNSLAKKLRLFSDLENDDLWRPEDRDLINLY
jgi:hypothetical protein